ncbi:MAG: DUF1566 domain-containing protein [Sulfuricurvum sp.]
MKKALLALTLITAFANAEMVHLNDKEVVLDTDTKLIWQDNSDAKTVKRSWNGAMDYCKNLSFGGYNNWKLPNIETLKTLYLKKQYLRNTEDEGYWSSNDVDYNSGWYVYFYDGYDSTNTKDSNYYVRCVRDNRELSKTPFVDIQKITQKKLNTYLSIPIVPMPTLPAPLNLVKDDFESKAEFALRVKNETSTRETEIANLQEGYRIKVEVRNRELEKLQANAEAKKKEFLLQAFSEVMGVPIITNSVYDPETDTMFVSISMSNAEWKKKIAITIKDRNEARELSRRLTEYKSMVEVNVKNDTFVFESIKIANGSKQYQATLSETEYKPQRVAVTLENKKVAFNELQNPNLVDKYQVSALGYSDSASAKGLKYNDDLAPLVKSLKQAPIDPKKWLFAIAVEKYDEADPVIYATNSANSFISVMQKRLGIDERHTYSLLNEKATTGGIKGGLERMLSNVKEGDFIYFYYSGHGIPDPVQGEPYILPKDVIADYVVREKELMARSIYKKLSDSSASRIIAFVDSCYSGRTDGVSNIKGSAAGHFKSKQVEFDTTKMAVFTAGTNGQFSNAFPEKGNRLFSYYLVKALATKENLDLDTLSAEVYANVKEESLKMGDIKRQEPQIEGNRGIGLR